MTTNYLVFLKFCIWIIYWWYFRHCCGSKRPVPIQLFNFYTINFKREKYSSILKGKHSAETIHRMRGLEREPSLQCKILRR